MALFTGNGYLVTNITALLAIPASDRPAFRVALLVQGSSWYEYDNAATTGGLIPADSPTTGRWFAIAREVLRVNRTYYVRTDGLDSNDGLANTSGGAFLTIAKFFSVLNALDKNGFSVTCQLANGTYSIAAQINANTGFGTGTVTLIGDTTTPSNVIITANATATNIYCSNCDNLKLQGFMLVATGSAVSPVRSLLKVERGSVEIFKIDFNAVTGTAFTVHIEGVNGIVNILSYSISSSVFAHYYFTSYAVLEAYLNAATITLTGSPNFSTAFAYIDIALAKINKDFIAFSGSATGARYLVSGNGVIQTNAGGASFLSGNSAGTTSTGGQYL